MTGWLASPFGRKRLLMLSVTGFTTASFFCGLAPSLPFLILFRIIQGACGGGLQPLSQAILLESFPAEKRGIAMVETMQVRKSHLHINILGEHVNPANPLARQTWMGCGAFSCHKARTQQPRPGRLMARCGEWCSSRRLCSSITMCSVFSR
jgi:hypothetical protein